MAGPYVLDFGTANAGGSPTFTTYKDAVTGSSLTAPSITEIGDGLYKFTATFPAGTTEIAFKATLAGVELSDVVSVVSTFTTPITSVLTTSGTGIPTLPTGVLEASGRYFSDFLVSALKRRAKVPVSQATLDTWEILATADEQIRSYVVPLMLQVGEDYMTAYADTVITSDRTYRAPARSMKIREIQLLDTAGEEVDFPRVAIEELPYQDDGFYFKGNEVTLHSASGWVGYTLRIWYYVRPSRLVTGAEAGVVSGINRGSGAVTLYGAVTGLTGATAVDLVNGRPPFDAMALDVPCSVSGTTVTITTAANIPADWGNVGDLVCLSQQTPAPQIHPDLWDLLVQACAVDLLDGQGDDPAFARAKERRDQLRLDAGTMLRNRVEGEPTPVGGHNPIWDRTWDTGTRGWWGR